MMMDQMRETLVALAAEFGIRRVILFGSRADGTYHESSDVDLIVEFNRPVTLMQLASLKYRLEESWGLDVEIIHGPVRPDDLIDVKNEVELYAA